MAGQARGAGRRHAPLRRWGVAGGAGGGAAGGREHHPAGRVLEARRDRDHEAGRRHRRLCARSVPDGGRAPGTAGRFGGGRLGLRGAVLAAAAAGAGFRLRRGGRAAPDAAAARGGASRLRRHRRSSGKLDRRRAVPQGMIAVLAAAALAHSLPEVQQRLAEERSAAQKLAAREGTVLGRLADLERQIEVGTRALRAAESRLRAAGERLAAAEENARKAQDQLDRAAEGMRPRLLARYKAGREGYVRILLGASNITDLLRRSRLLNALLRADLESLTVLRDHSRAAKAARKEVAVALGEEDLSVKAEAERRAALQRRV